MRPVDWRELAKICQQEGCTFERTRGDHYVMRRPGLARPVVFPMKRDLREDIVLSVARTLSLSRAKLDRYLDPSKRRSRDTGVS